MSKEIVCDICKNPIENPVLGMVFLPDADEGDLESVTMGHNVIMAHKKTCDISPLMRWMELTHWLVRYRNGAGLTWEERDKAEKSLAEFAILQN